MGIIFLYTTQEKENRNFVVIYFICSYFLYKNLVVQKSSLYENYESEVLLKTSITCYNVCIILCFRWLNFNFGFVIVFCANLLINILN